MKLPEQVACLHCGTFNRLGKAICKKCMRPIPQVEDVLQKQKQKYLKFKDKEVEKPSIYRLSTEEN